jgi:hypothetical protein
MNAAPNDGELDETSSIKLYMDLTGASESCARSVYMFVGSEKDDNDNKPNGLDRWKTDKTESQKTVAQTSRTRAESESEFGVGLLGNQGLVTAGK